MSSKGFKLRLAMRIEQHDRVESIKTLESLVETLLAITDLCGKKSCFPKQQSGETRQ